MLPGRSSQSTVDSYREDPGKLLRLGISKTRIASAPARLRPLLFLTLGVLTDGAVEAADLSFKSPEPRFAIRMEGNVMVPMRDSVKLATDLYFPVGAGEKLPAILIRTPYDKHGQEISARMFAGQAYIAAVQDVRGKFASEGVFTLSENDTNDGADTVTWMATQPW